MLRPLILLVFALSALIAPLYGQSKEEEKFRAKQADTLHGYAEDAFDEGFPLIAKRIWLMLLSEYDNEHAEARLALGYQKVGSSWSMKADFEFPTTDSPDAKAAKKLRDKWKAISGKMAKAHVKMAEGYTKDGRTDLAAPHWEKVLFFVPDDEEAQAALEHKAVAGVTGTDLEQTLYERSKKIEKAVAEEARKDYPVEVLGDDARNALLDRAKLEYKSVQSEHFTVRGDYDVGLLIEAAMNGERAIRIMAVVCEGYEGFNDNPDTWLRDWAFFKDKESYKQALKANSDGMSPEDLAFLLENGSSSGLFGDGEAVKVAGGGNDNAMLDGAVRSVAQSYSGLRSDALSEGIGHTIVGMFFNNNRLFSIDREEQVRSSTKEEDLSKYSINYDTWKDLALEAAWKLSEGTPAARLPVIKAAKFPDDARIKSWSFCDYMVRRDPTLLLDMDRLSSEMNEIGVEQEFTKAHDGLSIAQLEKEWKDFWTGASPVLKAIQNNTEPLASVSKDVKKWLEAFNDARRALGTTEVTWSATFSGRCKDHVEYLKLNEEERGPAAEQTQKIDLEGGTHLGDMTAHMALVSTDAGKPKDLFKEWMLYPGYRDALMTETLRTIGIYADKDYLVIDVMRGVGKAPEDKKGYRVYPNNNDSGVPTQVDVAALGPEIKALLEAKGMGDKEVLGFPLTLHFGGQGGITGRRDSHKCQVTIGGKPVEGFMHIADGGKNRRSSAPGLVVFYPLEPLKKGQAVEAVWTFEHEGGTSRSAIEFNT